MTDLFGNTGIAWTDENNAIFEWARKGKGNLVVRARAGSGKTSSVIEALMHAPEERILVAAFAKDIQIALEARIKNARAHAKTLHALGFGFLKRMWPNAEVDSSGSRAQDLVCRAIYDLWPKELFPETSKPRVYEDISHFDDQGTRLACKILTSARDVVPFAMTEEEVLAVIYELDHVPEAYIEAQGWTCEVLARIALRAMELALEKSPRIDFADMVYLPLRNRWVRPTYDLVCVDEAQDMNKGQLEFARRICKPGGRIMVVGDDRQGMYSWRGADTGSLDRLKAELNAIELPLTTTWRCPQVVVDYAQTLVPDIKARPNAPTGTIETIKADKLFEMVKPGDFVLSRINAPLMKAALTLIRNGVRAKILGKDIGQRLATIAKKLHARGVEDFYAKLGQWANREIGRARKAKREGQAQLVCDQADTLRALLFGLNDLSMLFRRIEDLFGDREASAVQFSTVHKAKGLEADTVYVLKDTLYIGKNKLEESNIEYVAVTRAKNRLIWVNGFNAKKKTSVDPQPWEDKRWVDPPWAEADYADDAAMIDPMGSDDPIVGAMLDQVVDAENARMGLDDSIVAGIAKRVNTQLGPLAGMARAELNADSENTKQEP
jgi:DNA helicase-2/ATP-dependent DNA helicase PcrA